MASFFSDFINLRIGLTGFFFLDGVITHTGKFEELINNPNVADVFKTLEHSDQEESPEDEAVNNDELNDDAESDNSEPSAHGSIRSRFSRHSTVRSKRKSRMTVDSQVTRTSYKSTKSARNQAAATKMIQEEFAATGRVSSSVYYSYFQAMSIILFLLFGVFYIGNAITGVGRSLWLSNW